MSDYKGAALLASLPQARELLADRGYDADWFRNALSSKGITPCIPGRHSRKTPVAYDKELYKQRHKIEIMLAGSRIGVELPRDMTVVPHLLFRHLHRCLCHLLYLMSPEPRWRNGGTIHLISRKAVSPFIW